MLILEAVVLPLGTAVLRAALKTWAGSDPLADELIDLLVDEGTSRGARSLEDRKLQRFYDETIDRVVLTVKNSTSAAFDAYTPAEADEIVSAASSAFGLLKDFERLAVVSDLDVDTVLKQIKPALPEIIARFQLGSEQTRLFDALVRDSCVYLTQIVASLPDFRNLGVAELLRRTSQISERFEVLLARLPKRRDVVDFETEYRQQLIVRLNKMQLFGTDFGAGVEEYPLSLSYVSLRVSGGAGGATLSVEARTGRGSRPRRTGGRSPGRPMTEQQSSSAERVEEVLRRSRRLLVKGEAGSGKTTLLRWLAVRCACKDLSGTLEQFNELIPFYIVLRNYAGRRLPRPEEFMEGVAPNIVGELPESWVQNLLRSGRALLLIDGIDELPDRDRVRALTWIRDLTEDYPDVRCVVTSRPQALRTNSSDLRGFDEVDYESMTLPEILEFVHQWHLAVGSDSKGAQEHAVLAAQEQDLKNALAMDRHLRRLAVNPLLCALLCTLNRRYESKLPRSRMEVYNAAVTMLVDQRDRARPVFVSPLELNRPERLELLQRVAIWFVRNGRSEASLEEVTTQVEISLRLLGKDYSSETVTAFLLERSGVLRAPSTGRVDFIHRTFQEYLAGSAAVQDHAIDELLSNAGNDQWREVIIMAAGHASQKDGERLIEGLLERHRCSGEPVKSGLLVVGCLQTAFLLRQELRTSVELVARSLMPPPDFPAAEALAAAGDFVIDYLPTSESQPLRATCVRTAGLVGGADALAYLATCAEGGGYVGSETVAELVRAWDSFEPAAYASAVMRKIDVGSLALDLDSSHLPLLKHLEVADSLKVDFIEASTMAELGISTRLRILTLTSADLPYRPPEAGTSIEDFVETQLEVFPFVLGQGVDTGAYRELRRTLEERLRAQVALGEAFGATYLRHWLDLLAATLTWASGMQSVRGFHTLNLVNAPYSTLGPVPPVHDLGELQLTDWWYLGSLDGLERWRGLGGLVISSQDVHELDLVPVNDSRLTALHLLLSPDAVVDLDEVDSHPTLLQVVIEKCELIRWHGHGSRAGSFEVQVCPHQEIEGQGSASWRVRRDLPCHCP